MQTKVENPKIARDGSIVDYQCRRGADIKELNGSYFSTEFYAPDLTTLGKKF